MFSTVRFFKIGVLNKRIYCSLSYSWNLPVPELNINYLCNENNKQTISNNIKSRKGIGDIESVLKLKSHLDVIDSGDPNYQTLQRKFNEEALKIPNQTHSDVTCLENPHAVKHIGTKKIFNFEPKEFYEISKRLNLIRTDQLGNVSGNRSYFVLGELAELEHALIKYTIDSLLKNKFEIIYVPDIIHRDIIEGCGLNTKGTRTQVYTLEPKVCGPNLCLSGTSEMALVGYFMNKTFNENELPIKVGAVSRCYRAEVSSVAEERGIYRVHQFTKVEMFAVSTKRQSDELLEEFRTLEENNFSNLNLHLRTLDMPPHELGPPAYRKYDVEAWLPGRNMYGEISSCSNCTDYQSRRLGIRYKRNGEIKFAHTLNGTACAIPRMLIALVETFQTDKGFIEIPTILQKYMRNKKSISRQKPIPELRFVKNKK